MDLRFTSEEEAFREEVRTFLKEKLPPRIANKVRTGKRLAKTIAHAQKKGGSESSSSPKQIAIPGDNYA